GLAPILPVSVKAAGGGRYTLTVGGIAFGLEPGIAAVRVGDDTRQLATAPRVEKGRLLVPLQLVSEVIPDVVVNTSWDAERRHLVLFSMIEHGRGTQRASTERVRAPVPAPELDSRAPRSGDASVRQA